MARARRRHAARARRHAARPRPPATATSAADNRGRHDGQPDQQDQRNCAAILPDGIDSKALAAHAGALDDQVRRLQALAQALRHMAGRRRPAPRP